MSVLFLKEFALLTLYGVMEDGYINLSFQNLTEVEEELIKKFKGVKEKVKEFFSINYHKIYRQDNRFQSFYIVENQANIEFLKMEKREYLEKLIRDILINVYSSLYTITQHYEYSEELETLSKDKLFYLLKSFGLYEEFLNAPATIQRRILASLIRMYKRKGTVFVYNIMEKIFGINSELSEVYAFVPFDKEDADIVFEYYDTQIKEWRNFGDINLYNLDVRAFVEKERF